MAIEKPGLQDLLEHGLQDIYYAEGRILKALEKMIDAAQDDELREALEQHRDETGGHIGKLEEIFEELGSTAKGTKCEAMDGILKEGETLLKDFGDSPAGDAAIIFSAQAVEHYEIARYGSMRAWAELLGENQVVRLIEEILDEEEAADEKLSMIAEDRANPAAAGDGEDEADENEDDEEE
ncbi:MAG TPA: ferritin-like domain-containing protein [Paracoccus sp. (in: a-proteobacteria)]|nr:ferritin-like domain-containing protein [Paracoccus sp. (in: a-proteobacteria)]